MECSRDRKWIWYVGLSMTLVLTGLWGASLVPMAWGSQSQVWMRILVFSWPLTIIAYGIWAGVGFRHLRLRLRDR